MKVIGKRSRGRQKIRWSDCLSKDLKERELKEEDAMDREQRQGHCSISMASQLRKIYLMNHEDFESRIV